MNKRIVLLFSLLPMLVAAQSRFSGSVGFGVSMFKPLSEKGFDHRFQPQAGFFLNGEVGFYFAGNHELLLRTSGTNVKYTTDYAWIALHPNDPAIPEITEHHHRFMEIGIGYMYHHSLTDKLGLCIAAGTDYSAGFRYKETTTFGDGATRETDYFIENHYFSGRVGVGLQSSIDRIGIRFLPEVRFFPQQFDYFSSKKAFAFCCTLALCFR